MEDLDYSSAGSATAVEERRCVGLVLAILHRLIYYQYGTHEIT